MNANITATNYVTYVNAELHFKDRFVCFVNIRRLPDMTDSDCRDKARTELARFLYMEFLPGYVSNEIGIFRKIEIYFKENLISTTSVCMYHGEYLNDAQFKEKALEQFLDSLGIRLSSGADIREHMRRT